VQAECEARVVRGSYKDIRGHTCCKS
jgi:hypothetical protein